MLLTATGYGKRCSLDEFSSQSRAGKGVIAVGSALKAGGVAAARVVQPADDAVIISEEGQVLRVSVEAIPRMGRSARGARLINLKEGDRAVSIARVQPEEDDEDASKKPARPASESASG